MQDSPDSNQQSLIPVRMRYAFPSTNILAQRKHHHRRVLFLFWMYYIGGIYNLLVLFAAMASGTLTLIWKAFLSFPLIERILYPSLIGAGLLAFLGPLIRNVVDEYLQTEAYQRLYQHCHYVDPIQMIQFRLPYAVLLNPTRFEYAFLRSKLVLMVMKSTDREYAEDEDGVDFLDDTDEDDRPTSAVGKIVAIAELSSAHTDISNEIVDEDIVEGEVRIVEQEENAEIRQKDISKELQLLIVIHQTVSFFLVERTSRNKDEMKGKKVEISLAGNSYYEAIVVYLAIQEPGKSVRHDVLKEAVYGNKIMNNDDIQKEFDGNKSRIRERIRKSIEKEFPHWADSVNKFDLFERSNARENSSWRLSESCEVQGPGLLLKFYQRVQVIKTGMDTIPITEKELTHMALLAIKHYSNNYLKKYTNHEEYRGGYLVDKLSEDPFESWAGDFFQECRRKYICILRYVAECLFQIWRDTRKKKYLDLVTMVHKECAYAATCEPLDQVLGEEALRFCIDTYMCDDNREKAQEVYDVYKKRVSRVLAVWKPEKKTIECLERHDLLLD